MMKTHRFFVEQLLEGKDEIRITEQAIIHQMRDVLRLRVGDPVILLDGTGIEYHGRVKILIKKESIISKEKIKSFSNNSKISKIKVHLFASLIKKDKFEWVLQKATEIGVSRITPVISSRTEKQKLNMERADKIVREASEQSERLDIPFLDEPVDLYDAIQVAKSVSGKNSKEGDANKNILIALDMDAPLIDVKKIREDGGNVFVFIGPEGGWDEKDKRMFQQEKVCFMSLGESVLRAETASVSISSLLLLG